MMSLFGCSPAEGMPSGYEAPPTSEDGRSTFCNFATGAVKKSRATLKAYIVPVTAVCGSSGPAAALH
jgi:hypothetical protein